MTFEKLVSYKIVWIFGENPGVTLTASFWNPG